MSQTKTFKITPTCFYHQITIIWWSKHVGANLNVLVCDIWINILLQTRALVGPLNKSYINFSGNFERSIFLAHSQNCENRLLPSSSLSVRPSVRNNAFPTGWIIMKFDIRVFFRKTVEKIQVWLKSDKDNGYFTCTPIYIWSHLTQFCLE
jgi:hypothetical protein